MVKVEGMSVKGWIQLDRHRLLRPNTGGLDSLEGGKLWISIKLKKGVLKMAS
jgi:hypothetical protein